MPSVNFWGEDETIVVAPKRNYTVNDFKEFFDDIEFPTGYEYWLNNKDLLQELTPPEVELHEIYSLQMPTPGVFLYNN
ncbi:unnamed protein product, partial [Rotaria magnacalcarata]